MNESTPQMPEAALAQGPRKRSEVLRMFLRRDKTPVAILIVAAVVGTVAGLLGVAFEKAENWVKAVRLSGLGIFSDYWILLWPLTFVFSAMLAMCGYYLVRRFAPEAGGSGIPEIEGALEELRPVRWWRVIPVKFFGGMGTLGAGMVLGREGPTVQMGANVGKMMVDIFRLRSAEARHSLLATGAAAGLSAAFNAPLAGILFIIEEMRLQFRYSLISIKAVFIGVIMSSIVFRIFNGEGVVVEVGKLASAPLNTLWLYLVLGMVFGVVGVGFNALIFRTQDMFARIHGGNLRKVLLIIFIVRVITTLLCFASGAPGGIFAPMLALGTLLGTAFGSASLAMFPQYGIEPATFAIAGMGALFAASVRAPLTGIVLVLEMTDNYQLILPMIITCLGATLLAQFLGGKPLYSAILTRTLQRQERENAVKAKDEPRGEGINRQDDGAKTAHN